MTTEQVLPFVLENLFLAANKPQDVLVGLLPALCEVLQTDRCFLHVRNPYSRMYQNICWRYSPEIPDTSTNGWEPEMLWEQEDPMFAAALRSQPSIFIVDVELASSDVLNIDFEQKYFGHRALVHAHLCDKELLWGILQPCIFGRPRVWSEFDRFVIAQVVERLKPFILDYVKNATMNEES